MQIGGEGVGACEKLLESAGRAGTAGSDRKHGRRAAQQRFADAGRPAAAASQGQAAGAARRRSRFGRRSGTTWYYFQPRELLQALPELDSTDLARHLRELTSLDAVDYVPPFRGRAIHMRERDRPFDELEIDFEALEQHKAAEYERIEHRGALRPRPSLPAAGDPALLRRDRAPACGHCDNCDATSARRPRRRSPAGRRRRARSRADRAQRRGPRLTHAQRLRQAAAGADAVRLDRRREWSAIGSTS